MKCWIVTGGVATGKSSFSVMLRDLTGGRSSLFSCDEEARQLWLRPEVVSEISGALGNQVIRQDGGLDRNLIRQKVFSEPETRDALERILHPRILRALEISRAEAEDRKAKVFLAEVPLYYEIRQSIMSDSVVVVAASRTVQVNRLMVRRNLDAATAENLLKAQLPLDVKIDKADWVVWNEGSESMLKAQASTIIRAHLEN